VPNHQTSAKRPEKVASLLLTVVILTSTLADDLEYGRTWRKDPNTLTDVINGTALAPAQYRIGIFKLADFFGRHTPLAMRHWLTVIGMISAFVAVFTLFTLLRRSKIWQTVDLKSRWFAALAFVFLVQFYLGWIVYFQRPETLPTAAFVALVLLLISVPLPMPKAAGTLVTATGLVLLAAWQGFVRPDAAFALFAGIILLGLTTSAAGLALPRIPLIVSAAVAGGLAFAVQFYLMHLVYPQTGYGDTPMIQLFLNLKGVPQWSAFALFMVPPAWTIFQVLFRHIPVDPTARAITYAALFFLGLWLTFGRMEEVRIYLPFALALTPCTVAVALQKFLGASEPDMKPQAIEP
jgi:hypothetical protein